jgi:hypothetical protein
MIRSAILAAALSLLAALALPHAAFAAGARPIGWDALRPAATAELADPFATLTHDQLEALRALVRIRTLEARGFVLTDEAKRQREASIRKLEAQGLDPEALIQRRDAALAQRRKAAEAPVASLDGLAVRLAGFLLPSAWQGDKVVEFVLVSMPGACSHATPPPANQVVRVRPAQPSTLAGAYEPATVTGKLRVRAATKPLHVVDGEMMLTSAYAIDSAVVEPLAPK